MVIGIDLRALQTGHKFRGIGEVAKQVTNRVLSLGMKDGYTFIFYEYDDDDPKKLLSIPKGLKYDTVKLGKMPENDNEATITDKLKRNFRELYGNSIKGSEKSDVYLQFDYAFGVPRNTKTVLIEHDLIPLVFWDRFFESAWVPFKNRAARTTLRTLFANYKYKRILHRGVRNAYKIVSVSNSTKNDLESLLHVPSTKITVAHLGVDMKPAKTVGAKKPESMPTKPYLLFVGAGDERRRVDDLVAAYNNLKADGRDIQLVLVGENFKKAEYIPNKATREAVLASSYKSDILTLGYVDDATKQTLFKNALAFVYPTKYEGFGIPILESFLLEAPVITYKNSSIPEVGGEHAIYVKGWQGIKEETDKLLQQDEAQRNKKLLNAKSYAKNFTWDKTADLVYKQIRRALHV